MSEQARLLLKILQYIGAFASEIEYHGNECKIPEEDINLVIEWLEELKEISNEILHSKRNH